MRPPVEGGEAPAADYAFDFYGDHDLAIAGNASNPILRSEYRRAANYVPHSALIQRWIHQAIAQRTSAPESLVYIHLVLQVVRFSSATLRGVAVIQRVCRLIDLYHELC